MGFTPLDNRKAIMDHIQWEVVASNLWDNYRKWGLDVVKWKMNLHGA